MKRPAGILFVFALLLAGCNQPFEPSGPVDHALVVYGILSSRNDTQYVRLTSTFGNPPAPEIRDAAVTLTTAGWAVSFRDTTVLWRDTAGNLSATNVYVAYNAHVTGGAVYQLRAATPPGLSASATATALGQPFFTLKPFYERGNFVLSRQFRSMIGAAVIHFYLDYYALVNNGWELHTEEVPAGFTIDALNNQVFSYPSLASVEVLASTGTDVRIDSALFQGARVRVFKKYQPAPVVFLDIRFVLTQIDDALYDYYYINNGPADLSTIRLDVPDFTNIQGGHGLFGSRAEVILLYPLDR
jgi:hypothetical protein